MKNEIAVVFDVAGTLLKMYRVAKDVPGRRLLRKVTTTELIMAKDGRALVVPQVDPQEVLLSPPDTPLGEIFPENLLEISCSSTPVGKEAAASILRTSRAMARDLQEACQAVVSRCCDLESYMTAGVIIDTESKEVAYALSTGGVPFLGSKDVLGRLTSMGADIYVASGDSMRSLVGLSRLGISRERISAVASPRQKCDLVTSLKECYGKVVMVGDGLNDLHALKAADLGVLTMQQDSRPPQKLLRAADTVIRDIRELPEIVKNGIKLIV